MAEFKNEAKYLLAIEDLKKDNETPIAYLADKYSFDRGCFSRYLRRNGHAISKKGRSKETTDLYRDLAERYKEGESILSLSEKYGVSRKSLGTFVREPSEVRDKKTVNESFFESIDTEAKAYWLGFIYADGSVTHSKIGSYKLAIELNDIDTLHLKKFLRDIESDASISRRKGRPMASVAIYRKKIVTDLFKLGCVPDKTNKGFIDFRLREDLLRHFIRGYFDGDGHIEKNYKKYRASIVVKSENIMRFLEKSLTDFCPRIQKDKGLYRIHIETKEGFFGFIEYMYNDTTIYLDRKYNTYKDRMNAHLGSTLLKS